MTEMQDHKKTIATIQQEKNLQTSNQELQVTQEILNITAKEKLNFLKGLCLLCKAKKPKH